MSADALKDQRHWGAGDRDDYQPPDMSDGNQTQIPLPRLTIFRFLTRQEGDPVTQLPKDNPQILS